MEKIKDYKRNGHSPTDTRARPGVRCGICSTYDDNNNYYYHVPCIMHVTAVALAKANGLVLILVPGVGTNAFALLISDLFTVPYRIHTWHDVLI